MYSKYTTLLVLCVFFVAPVFSQTTTPLSPDQDARFLEQRILLELPGVNVVDASGELLQVGYTRHWKAYQGYTPLSETDFFELVNQSALADEAKRKRRVRLMALGLGGLGIVAGATMFATHSSSGLPSDGGLPSMGVPIAGGLLMTAGLATAGFAALSMRQRHVPYWMAEEVADTYNAQLWEELQWNSGAQ